MTEFIMPKMGESVFEATVIRWLKNVGDTVKKDESILEVATDKVDTEVPSSVEGVLSKILVKEGEVAKVGMVIAEIVTLNTLHENVSIEKLEPEIKEAFDTLNQQTATIVSTHHNPTDRFYSPLVINIARQEGISMTELESMVGSGKNNRVTKQDILDYVAAKKSGKIQPQPQVSAPNTSQTHRPSSSNLTETAYNLPLDNPKTIDSSANGIPQEIELELPKKPFSLQMAHEIVEMDRMRKIISQRMIESRRISAHVTSFVEADVTNMVIWRGKIKHEFMRREGEGITYTPIFIDCVAKALKDFPLLNSSVFEDKIIIKKEINIGIAVALDDGNLIVPVVKNADRYNITGLTKTVNQLIKKAKNNKLTADDLADGTYTISNVGTFGNVMGTPIIVQPQVGILALGTIQKKPAVIETEHGDTIGIRHMMYLSHSYDHRIIDGSLGGAFVRKVADYLENWDLNKSLS